MTPPLAGAGVGASLSLAVFLRVLLWLNCGAMTLSLPTGTVTFLLTDIEGSTQAWERAPDAMRLAR